MAVLTSTARLFDQLADAVRVGGDCFPIRDLRFARVRVHFEFAEHAVANDFQMQLAHAGDDGLAGVFVGVNLEGRIFLGQTRRRPALFSWSTFVFGSIAIEMTGSGNVGGSSRIGWSSSQSVSPVVMFLMPTIAAISPE